MEYSVIIGSKLPKFHGESQDGKSISDTDLLGKVSVIYFYPKDDTPGCTLEACSFRDNMERLHHFKVNLIGISPDNSDSHDKFISKHQLNFPLLSDHTQAICRAFDVLHTQEIDGKPVKKLERSTFIVDTKGIIRWIERPVNVQGHVDRVISAVQQLTKSS